MIREKIALLLIEFQNEWLEPDGKIRSLLEDEKQLKIALTNAKKVLSTARDSDLEMIHVGLQFSNNHKILGEADHGLRQAIANFGTFSSDDKGSKFASGFEPHADEFVVDGRTGASAFSGSNLDSYLRNNRITNLYLMGFAMHVCVESTLREAHDKGYNTTLIEDASAAFTEDQRQHVLDHVVHHFGNKITANEFIQLLERRIVHKTS